MSTGLASDEVADDYKNSLEDLVMNSRYEISNLTVIAKENTEHALAISRVLENHIKTTSPDRKLPALYLLDSIVKNVGTPYTLFFGRNLYNTFMNAYSLVNSGLRKKLDEMLKTWKEPLIGSTDQRPVFLPEITRPIENALIKARTAAVQQQHQQQFRSQQELSRGRPTPPQANGQFRPPGQGAPSPNFPPQGYPPQQAPNGNYLTHSPYPQFPQQPPPQQAPIPYQQPFQQPPFQGPPFQQPPLQQPPLQQPPLQQPPLQQPPLQQYPPPGPNLGILHRDIDSLIRAKKDDFAANPYDTGIQTQLKALLDLQAIMQRQQLPPDQIQMVRNQVDALSPAPRPAPALSVPSPIPYNGPSFPTQHTPSQPHPAQHPPPPPQPADLHALLSSNNLADIVAKAQRGSVTPPVAQASPAQSRSIPAAAPPNPMAALMNGGSDLMASLRAAGLVAADARTPTNGKIPFNAPPVTLGRSGPVIDVQLTSASLKQERPYLIRILYEDRPNQCATCGRRFLATEQGRAKKVRHLDWHFKTNQRMADNSNRGQSRSWYVDEMEWIKSRDDPEDIASDASAADSNSLLTGGKANAMDPKTKYIPVPSDQTIANLPCPICQEKFDTVWNDEAQDFVWMDAVRVGGRVYHASCHSEVWREEGARTPVGAGGRTGTPDSVLGKRKAENDGLKP